MVCSCNSFSVHVILCLFFGNSLKFLVWTLCLSVSSLVSILLFFFAVFCNILGMYFLIIFAWTCYFGMFFVILCLYSDSLSVLCSSLAKSEYSVRVSWSHVFNNPRHGRAHKLISFIVFLHVLKASASNGSKNKKW